MNRKLGGIVPPLTTPFDAEGELALELVRPPRNAFDGGFAAGRALRERPRADPAAAPWLQRHGRASLRP